MSACVAKDEFVRALAQDLHHAVHGLTLLQALNLALLSWEEAERTYVAGTFLYPLRIRPAILAVIVNELGVSKSIADSLAGPLVNRLKSQTQHFQASTLVSEHPMRREAWPDDLEDLDPGDWSTGRRN